MMSFYTKALFDLFPKLPPNSLHDNPLYFELPPDSFEKHSSYGYDDPDDDDWPDWFQDGTEDDN
jgi:hypothetical protein